MKSAVKKRRDRVREPRPQPGRSRRFRRVFVGAIVLMVIAAAIWADWWFGVPPTAQAHFVGGSRCVECHQQEAHAWRGSHHDRAMQPATEATVLGDFNDASLVYHGIEARMFRRDGRFVVHTEGPDGVMQDFEVKYVFGVEPLQQYMVEIDRPADLLPGQIGRVQVLRETWDTEQQRWFYLPPPDVHDRLSPSDDLHWTGIGQRWNTMCADCHSTNLQKNFDPSKNTYHTTFTDMQVHCEACHGPGSIHVELASSFSLFWDRHHGYGLADLKSSAENEIQACAPCHARRRILADGYAAGANYYDFFATHVPDPLTYFADGQILDEVYEHGSFLQSKMYHRHIRCSDCHDPHTARLKHTGNQVCTSCHQHPAGKYDTPAHHRHQPGSTGASCVECHMPATTYMEVDARRDHSLRVPRPDLSVEFGVPNACTRCHLDRVEIAQEDRAELRQYQDWLLAARNDEQLRDALRRVDSWAAEKVAEWFPEGEHQRRQPAAAELLARTWRGESDAEDAAMTLIRQTAHPAIFRAAALQWLAQNPTNDRHGAAERCLEDAEPLVRAEAVRYFENVIPSMADLSGVPAEQAEAVYASLREPITKLAKCLEDPRRLVRIEAARVLSRVPRSVLGRITSGPQRQKLGHAIDELIASYATINDRAAGHAGLGQLYELQGDIDAARQAYETAIRVEPGFAGPRANLAQLLEHGLTRVADDRARREIERKIAELRAEELKLLERDAQLAPHLAEVHYRLGLARHLNGDTRAAVADLERAHQLDPEQPQYVLMLALVHERLEQYTDARHYAELLIEMVPNEPGYRRLLERIQARL